MDTSGNAVLTNNLTISGVLQSPLTNLIGVSINNVDGKIPTIGNNITTFGTTSNPFSTINLTDNFVINSSGSNSYIQFRSNTRNSNDLIGIISDDLFIRANEGNILFQTNANTKMTLNNSGNLSIGNSNNSYKLDVSGDSILRGTLDTTGRIDASGSNIMRGADALHLTHSGNCSFKITGGSYTYRYETQTDDEHYLFDGANNEVYHIGSDHQIWFAQDVNCAGTYFDCGIPLTPSSRRLKTNIKNLNEIENIPKILDKIDFKKYTKTYKKKTYDEIGVVIEELEEIPGIEEYNLIHTRQGGGEYDGLKYLKYVPFL